MFERPNGRAIETSGPRHAAPPSATSASEAEAGSLIRDALSYSEELASALHSEIGALELRLDTGLTPVGPERAGAGSCGSEPCARSHVLERIGTYNQALVAAVMRIRDLRLRIEL